MQQLQTNEIMTISEQFAKSGMFLDIKSAAQAMVKIQAGKEFGIQPFAAMTGIHIIQGKPVIGAGLMASRVKASGKYTYRVNKHDSTICEVEYFEKNGNELVSIGTSTFTIDDARKAGTKNLDKFPKNMLFARAMSNGVKWYTPDIYDMPVYVPEEMEHLIVTQDVTPISVTTEPETPVKPKLSAIGMEKAIKRIEAGEYDLIPKMVEAYDLDADQIELIEKSQNK